MMPFEKYDINGKRDINSATTMFDFDSKNRILSRKSFISDSVFNISRSIINGVGEVDIPQWTKEGGAVHNDLISLDLSSISRDYIKRIGYKRGKERDLRRKHKDINIFETIDKYDIGSGINSVACEYECFEIKESNNMGKYEHNGKGNSKNKNHRFVKSLYILSEIFLSSEIYNSFDEKPNLSKKLTTNSRGFYDFSEFDFSLVGDDIEYMNMSHYLKTIYLIPDAEINRICLKNLQNSFYFWINQKRKDLQLDLMHMEYCDCDCH